MGSVFRPTRLLAGLAAVCWLAACGAGQSPATTQLPVSASSPTPSATLPERVDTNDPDQQAEVSASGPDAPLGADGSRSGDSLKDATTATTAHTLPTPGEETIGLARSETYVRIDSEDLEVSLNGALLPGQRKTYLVEAVPEHLHTATLNAPPGVWLDAGSRNLASPPPDELPREAEAVLPADGLWQLDVVSITGEPAGYELTVTVHPPESILDTSGPVVYLTFDDGPHPVHTAEILDVLGRYDAKATFFVVGRMVQRFPEILDRIIEEGHTVANHTWNHENLTTLSAEAIDATVARTQEILGEHATPCLRPPYGAVDDLTRRKAAESGLDLVMWSASATDWLDIDAEAIADRIVEGAGEGAIILIHDGGGDRSRTVRGLEIALQRLSGQGFRYEPICVPE